MLDLDLIFPSIFKFSDSSTYFDEFIKKNKEQKISGRQISLELGWPTSLIVDLIKKRKPLTIQRASEFSRFAKFNSLEIERITWIALAETGDQTTQFFFKNKLNIDPEQHLLPSLKISDEKSYFYLMTVIHVLLHSQKKMTAQAIKNHLNLPSLQLNEIEKALTYTLKEKILIWDQENKSYIKYLSLDFDSFDKREKDPYQGINIHKYTTQNFLDFIENPAAPSAYLSGYVLLQKDQFMPIAIQLFHLKNLLLSIDQENINSRKENLRLIQFDFNLFKVTK